MVYSASFAGIIIFGLGVIRDYLGPGLSLIATKLTLALGYLLMWQAVPGESDNLLYGWVFQEMSLFLSYFFVFGKLEILLSTGLQLP